MFSLAAENLPLFLYTTIASTILIIFLLITISNWLLFPRLSNAIPPKRIRLVSILIPARNEEAAIGDTIFRILAQSYPHFELIILDDHSTDGTREIVRNWQARDGRVKLIEGEPLPDDWLGKNWACHQLAQAAQGRLLLFVDADLRWERDALAAIVALREQTRTALLTIWPTQLTSTRTEFFVIPLIKFVVYSYLPIIGVHYSRFPTFSAANGQCMLFSRSAYRRIGGHAAVQREIAEDALLAKKVKQAGLRLRMADGANLVACHMYHGWRGVRRGFGKTILASHNHSPIFLFISALFHWGLFVLPWVWLFFGGGWYAIWLIGLGLVLRGLSELIVDRYPGQALLAALSLPIGIVLMTIVAGQALRWHFGSGPRWKGRILRRKR